MRRKRSLSRPFCSSPVDTGDRVDRVGRRSSSSQPVCAAKIGQHGDKETADDCVNDRDKETNLHIIQLKKLEEMIREEYSTLKSRVVVNGSNLKSRTDKLG